MSIFTSIAAKRPKKNKFNLSHMFALSCKIGTLVPVLCKEVIPGDSWRFNTELFTRFSPMVSPPMGRMNQYIHNFFVPSRILWDEWEDFITGGVDGTLAPVAPYLTSSSSLGLLGDSTLADYLGIPPITVGTNPIHMNALPFRAYQTIYNEYYRDQTLTPEIVFPKTSDNQDANNVALMTLRNRCYRKDYFTSASPWTQRGPESVIPISQKIDTAYDKATGLPVALTADIVAEAVTGKLYDSDDINVKLELRASEAAATINDLRRSVRLQEWLEKNARGGARYVEQLLSHFGVYPEDARLQRPEYISGWKQPVSISEVLNTSGATDPQTGPALQPVGEMAGRGISVGNSHSANYNVKEHGFIMSILSTIPEAMYFQGVDRMWSRTNKLDYAWPEFAQLGEQEITNKEIYYTGAEANKDETFGYTPRYAEYKYACDRISGEFRSSLDHWHVARKFASQPGLNDDFVSVSPDDIKRIFSVTSATTDDLYVQIYHNISALRPLPYFGTPTL